MPCLVAHEFIKDGDYSYIAIFAYFTAIFEGIMMIITRGHYTIDIVCGFIFSFYVCRIGDLIIPYIDNSSVGLCNEILNDKEQINN